ncbi:MAG: endonuclease III [Melioribacteraceae bacterium]|nr:endonuclease III [Melioribacteraceae bacterium]
MERKTQNKIKRVTKILVDKFGYPYRHENLPAPLDMLIATILSQNTNDKNSYKAFQNLKRKYPAWEEALSAKESTIENLVRVAGLGKQKANAIKNLLDDLNSRDEGFSLSHITELSDLNAIEELTKYDGIGVKTASCLLLFALDRNVCPVDTHVFRTVNRLGIVSEKSRDKTYFILNESFPKDIAHTFHTNLIRLGREVCTPRNPSCGVCPVEKECLFEEKNLENKTVSAERDFMLLDNVRLLN